MPHPAQDNPNLRDNGSASRPIRLEFLDGLRGLAALYVVLFHLTASRFLVDASGARVSLPLPLRSIIAVTRYGHYAVALFIVLSGYSLMLPVVRSQDRRLRGGFASYLKRRAGRILPPYYAALLLSLLCLAGARQWREVNWETVGSHLLLVHNLRFDWYETINVPLWSVATEWDIYFLFPLLLLPLWRKWGMGAVLVAGFGLGWLPHFVMPPAFSLNWACPWYLGLFSLGMGAATVTAARDARTAALRPHFWSAIGALPATLFVAIAIFRPFWIEERQWILDPLVGAFAACLILACASARYQAAKPGLILRVLEHPRTLWLGAFSYSLYLTHILVKWGLYALLSRFALSPSVLLLCLLGLGVPASLLTGWGFYLLVERHFLAARSTARHSEAVSSETVSIEARPAQDAAENPARVT